MTNLPDLANDLLRGIASAQRSDPVDLPSPDPLSVMEDWLYYAEQKLREFAPEQGKCGAESGDLCSRCEDCGCIQDKIVRTRAAIAAAKGAPPPPAWVANFREARSGDEPHDDERDRDCGDEVPR